MDRLSVTQRVLLRPVQEADLPSFFLHQQDPQARWMAAFAPANPNDTVAFDARWCRVLVDPGILARTIEMDGCVVGHVASYVHAGAFEVTYWLDRAAWGRGIATCALHLFLQDQTVRPIWARVAKDNLASLRVLEKCGFAIVGEDSGYAHARGCNTEEWLLCCAR